MDRRVRRTRHSLKQAMLDLIEEVGYDRVTVGALTERADVGRSTFYSHYDSKEDLLFDGFEGWVVSVGTGGSSGAAASRSSSAAPADPARFQFSLPLLRHIADQRRFFVATMVRSRSSRIRRRVLGILGSRVRTELIRLGRDASEVSVRAVAGAFLEVATWWLEEDVRTPVEQVDAAFQRVLFP